MTSNYFQPNAAGHGQPHHPPLSNGHQFPPQQQQRGVAPYASLGGGVDHGSGNSYGTAGQNHAGQYGMGANQAAFSYSNLGTYGSLGGSDLMHSANRYQIMMNGGSNDFKYSSLAASGPYMGGGNLQQPMGRWNPQQQQQPQQHHHQDYLGHSYNQNPAYPNISYVANNLNNNNPNGTPAQPRRVPVAIPPPPPPLPEEACPDAKRRARWGDASREEGEVSPEASREDPPRLPPAARRDSAKPKPSKQPASKKPPAPAREGPPRKPSPKPPAPHPAASNRPREAASSTDHAVNAINALSSLQNRWAVPGGKGEETKNQRKKRRRRERARKNKNAAGGPSNPPVVLREGGENINQWIDVEDEASDKKQKREGQKSSAPFSKKRKLDGNRKDFEDAVSNLNNFPPLKPTSQGGDKDDARLVTLEELSTPQLASYSAALRGSLDAIGSGVADRAPKREENARDGAHVEDEEMDISDEEEAAQTSKKGEGKRPERAKSIEAPRETVVDLTSDQLADRIGSTTARAAPDKNVPDNPARPPKQDLERIEREKRALKLAELRAKAKLARAKLRIAEKKKARGNVPASATALGDGRATTSPAPVSSSPLPPRVRDIAVGSLVIEDVSLTGPPDEVRFVDDVYKAFSCDDQAVHQGITAQDLNKSVLTKPSAAQTAVTPSVGLNEENRKKSESLKQKLQLARLQLEMKKKELNKRKALSSATNGDTATSNHQQLDMKTDKGEKVVDDTPPKDPTPRAKLEQLRRRQKELKQKNDVANLRNLIHRQRGLLKAQGQELSESSAQLQSCIDSIGSKQDMLNASEQRLQEMHHRKRIIEGMVYRATEQLIAARKALSERRRHQYDQI